MDSFVEFCKQSAVEGMEWCLHALSFVPDDKLAWTPTPTSKSAIRIAAHTALYPAVFAGMIRDRKLPASDNLEAWLEKRNAAEVALATRGEIESVFRKGTEEVLVALDSVPQDAIGTSLDSGFGWSMPMTRLRRLPGIHALQHAAQIEYLQTCWDDQEVHV